MTEVFKGTLTVTQAALGDLQGHAAGLQTQEMETGGQGAGDKSREDEGAFTAEV